MEFLEYLNSIHPTIKFTHKYSGESIEFLDVLVKREGNTIHTDLFVKDTDTHQFLHFSSCHPFHTKKGIPYSQAVRMRRICSRDEFFEKRSSDLRNWLYSRGYEKKLVDTQIDRAASLDRDALLQNAGNRSREGGREIFSTVFHPALSQNIHAIFREAHQILGSDEEHKKVFSSVPMISFRRAKTLQDILVKSKLPSERKQGTCKGCGRSNCQVCNFLLNSSTFSDSGGNREFSIRKGDFNCNSKIVVYRLRCKTCGKLYVGSTITKFRERLNNYKSHFTSYCKRRDAGTLHIGTRVPQAKLFAHFLQDDHHGTSDWEFQIIDGAYKETQVRERESFWQHKLKTFLPIGLNERSVPT